jgi:hypothetical protein
VVLDAVTNFLRYARLAGNVPRASSGPRRQGVRKGSLSQIDPGGARETICAIRNKRFS